MLVSVYSLGCVTVVVVDACGTVDGLVATSSLVPVAAGPVPNCQYRTQLLLSSTSDSTPRVKKGRHYTR